MALCVQSQIQDTITIGAQIFSAGTKAASAYLVLLLILQKSLFSVWESDTLKREGNIKVPLCVNKAIAANYSLCVYHSTIPGQIVPDEKGSGTHRTL